MNSFNFLELFIRSKINMIFFIQNNKDIMIVTRQLVLLVGGIIYVDLIVEEDDH